MHCTCFISSLVISVHFVLAILVKFFCLSVLLSQNKHLCSRGVHLQHCVNERAADSADRGNARRCAQQHCDVPLWPHALHRNIGRQHPVYEVSADRSRWMDRLSCAQFTSRQGLYWLDWLTLLFVGLAVWLLYTFLVQYGSVARNFRLGSIPHSALFTTKLQVTLIKAGGSEPMDHPARCDLAAVE